MKEVVGAWEDSLKVKGTGGPQRSVRRKVMKALDDARLEKDGAGREIADMVGGKRRRRFLNSMQGVDWEESRAAWKVLLEGGGTNGSAEVKKAEAMGKEVGAWGGGGDGAAKREKALVDAWCAGMI